MGLEQILFLVFFLLHTPCLNTGKRRKGKEERGVKLYGEALCFCFLALHWRFICSFFCSFAYFLACLEKKNEQQKQQKTDTLLLKG